MHLTQLPPRVFAVDVVATACADGRALARWIGGSRSRRCAGPSPRELLLRDRVRVPADDPADAELVARRGMAESAAAAGVALGVVHARVRPPARAGR